MPGNFSVRRAFASVFLFISALLGSGSFSPALAAARGGLDEWIHQFNFGSGALVLNPVIILIQWANFLIFLVVLNKILYRPLLGLMEGRDKRIRDDLASAERDRSETQGYISQYEDSLAEIQRENTEAILALHQEMAESTRARVEEIRDRTAKELEEARASIAAAAWTAASALESRARGFAVEIANRLAGRRLA